MKIATRFPDDLKPGYLAWFVARALLGFADGCYPSFLEWGLPPLYGAGVRYQLEPGHGTGVEDFSLPVVTAKRGWGDCDDLTIWACCEYWSTHQVHPRDVLGAVAAGRVAKPWVQWQGNNLHALVWLPGGRLEDPSMILEKQQNG